jgi:leucyl aminopeptidase
MKIRFASPAMPKSGALVLLVAEGGALSPLAETLDGATKGLLRRAMGKASFEGKKDQTLDLVLPEGAGPDRLLLLGVGNPASLKARDVELMGGTIGGVLLGWKVKEATLAAAIAGESAQPESDVAALLASGVKLRAYSFLKYKSPKANDRPKLERVSVLVDQPAAAKKAFVPLEAVADGVLLARDLVNEPANILTPEEFAIRAEGLRESGVEVEVLTPKEMKKIGMRALLGVAQGSVLQARLVVMRWNGGRDGDPPVAFIGKGVTFDTGGISIKPAAGMEDMKGDMAGAACVVGLMKALALRKAKANVVGIIGLVENMPSGTAQRPGDIVKSLSGQTIAVLNTDAEGRLVLADALWYCQDRFKPKFMLDLATLTGAILVALGKEHAGLFCNNDELAERVIEAGIETGEKVWRLPLAPEYDKLIDSDIADMKNIGGRNAGSITAAQFLQRFVNGLPWAHLDIAGVGMDSTKNAINQSWGGGWGVRLLNRLVADHYEGGSRQ